MVRIRRLVLLCLASTSFACAGGITDPQDVTQVGGAGSGLAGAPSSGGGTTGGAEAPAPAASAPSSGSPDSPTTGSPIDPAPAPEFSGDASPMPAFGGWAWTAVPADAAVAAGFDWFETGYPGDVTANQILRDGGVRPFAYINLGELDPKLAAQAQYTGPILRTNADWGNQLVDVTDASWQSWIVRRADYAFSTGSRGVKWDVATPDLPPGKTRADVNAAIASMMQTILAQHPGMKFIFNQGFEFARAYPQYVHAIETEGLFSASSYPAAFLKPWLDPFYWGPQYQDCKALHDQHGTVILVAEYADPWSGTARSLYDAISAEGFVPYITNESWNLRGWGYGVPPGW